MRPALLVPLAIAAVLALALPRAGELRARAERGLERAMPAREAELAKGFVLGEDEGIDARTEEEFRRAGLSHLLAVSGQNVTLLALLALPLLASLGIPLRQRLLWVLALIAVYVPLTGAGPSIQRAAVMGALGILATLAGRRGSRFYALALAAGVTLAVDPGIGADVGWQLSFAALLGILLWSGPLRDLLGRLWGQSGRRRGVAAGLRGALLDGVSLTIAATVATAPLIAFHFERLSTTSLGANLLALPAVAPAMWLGMASSGAAQVPGFPNELLNAPNAVLLAYIAQVAAWCAAPEWSELEISLGGGALAAAYGLLALATLAGHAGRCWSRRPRVRPPARRAAPGAGPRFALASALALLAFLVWPVGGGGGPPARGLRVSFLDVGQGDATLLQPAGAPAILVDAGPPGAGLLRQLDRAGVERLGAVVVTHDQSDHAGGVEELLGAVPIDSLLYARLGAGLKRAAAAAGTAVRRASQGTSIRSGGLRLEFLWPPRELLGADVAEDPNRLSLVAVARWRRYAILLAGDAEAEAVPLDPGPIDLLKVSHHGSEDAGLADLLARSRPRLAVISVGAGNPFGHPSPKTLGTLAAQGVRVVRTDREGTIAIALP